MSINYNSRIVTSGLVELLESNLANGTSTQTISSKVSQSTFTLYNYSVGTSSNLKTFSSNADSSGAGTSYVTLNRNQNLETGSITFIIWFNVKGVPVAVGNNNNWRGLLCTGNDGTAGSPLTMVMEQYGDINFSTTHTDGYRRYTNNLFSPVTWNSSGWQMVSYTYNQSTGIAAAYKNNIVITTGPMTSDGSNTSPTTAGTALSYSNYQSSGFRIYGGINTSANPNGNGICPGELGNVMIYNRSLSSTEIQQNFNTLRGRYGV